MDKEQLSTLAQELDGMSDEQMMALLQEMGSEGKKKEEPEEQPPAPEKLRMTMSDGTVLEANSAAELNSMVRSFTPKAPEPASQTPAQNPEFDMKRYHELLIADPKAAHSYFEKTQYGAELTKIVPALIGGFQQMAAKVTELENRQFSSAVADPNERKIVDGLVAQYGWQANSQNREAAYELAKAKGLIGTTKKEEKTEFANNRGFVPPRTSSVARSEPRETEVLSAMDNLSDAKLEEYLYKNGYINKRRFS